MSERHGTLVLVDVARVELHPAPAPALPELDAFLLVAEPPAPRPAERPRQLGLLPAADSTVAATGLLF